MGILRMTQTEAYIQMKANRGIVREEYIYLPLWDDRSMSKHPTSTRLVELSLVAPIVIAIVLSFLCLRDAVMVGRYCKVK